MTDTEQARRAYERAATRTARERHADAPHGTRAARVRAEVSCVMVTYDVEVARARFYVRVDRTDGSRTYKGPLRRDDADREADAWRESFPEYGVAVLPVAEARDDVKRFSKVTAPKVDAPRYYPGRDY